MDNTWYTLIEILIKLKIYTDVCRWTTDWCLVEKDYIREQRFFINKMLFRIVIYLCIVTTNDCYRINKVNFINKLVSNHEIGVCA